MLILYWLAGQPRVGSLMREEGTLITLLVASSWYSCSFQVLAGGNLNKVVDNAVHHKCFVLLISHHWRNTTGFVCSHWSKFLRPASEQLPPWLNWHKCMESRLSLHILVEGQGTCSTLPLHPLSTWADFFGEMLLSGWPSLSQFVVIHDFDVLGLCCLFQSLAVYIIGCLDDLTHIYNLNVFTFVWIKHHLPVLFPFLKLV